MGPETSLPLYGLPLQRPVLISSYNPLTRIWTLPPFVYFLTGTFTLIRLSVFFRSVSPLAQPSHSPNYETLNCLRRTRGTTDTNLYKDLSIIPRTGDGGNWPKTLYTPTQTPFHHPDRSRGCRQSPGQQSSPERRCRGIGRTPRSRRPQSWCTIVRSTTLSPLSRRDPFVFRCSQDLVKGSST